MSDGGFGWFLLFILAVFTHFIVWVILWQVQNIRKRLEGRPDFTARNGNRVTDIPENCYVCPECGKSHNHCEYCQK